MMYVIGGALIIIAVLFAWAKIERAGKKRAEKTRDLAIENAMVFEKKLATVKINIDQVFDYETEDKERNKKVKQRIKTLKNAKKDTEVMHEIENIRSDMYAALITI